MIVVVNNITKREDIEFKERVLQTMKKQILKKIIGQADGATIKHSCDAPFIKRNNIEQIQNQTV